jgi:ABC-type transport system substrate-binding protein
VIGNSVHITSVVWQPFANCPRTCTDGYKLDQVGAEAIKFVPVGTGPWTIGEWLPNNRGDVHAVTDHWIEPPHIGTFTVIQVPDTSSRLAMMQTGEADIGEVDFGKLRELEGKGLKFITTMSDKDTMTLSAIWPGNSGTDPQTQSYLHDPCLYSSPNSMLKFSVPLS